MKWSEFVLKRLLGKKFLLKVVDNIFDKSDINFRKYVERRIGFKGYDASYREFIHLFGLDIYGNDEFTGEAFVREQVLPLLFAGHAGHPVFFDVGSNTGAFAMALRQQFDTAGIHCFEPNPITFAHLQKTAEEHRLIAQNIGLGEEAGQLKLFVYEQDSKTEHASLFRDVFSVVQKTEEVASVDCRVMTLDAYCLENHIEQIDFLKIDTEGYELFVLKGARHMLEQNRIRVVQFEFNEMNVVSRVFLKDFYDILPGFRFYRIRQGSLMPLGPYAALHEIFQYQNLLAIHPSVEVDLNSVTVLRSPL